MNIYFCGIGGVGLGPLAEIALDAGHTVQGSDAVEGLMTKRLTERGVAINTKQKGAFLQMVHNHQPIDWFVYTAGLPDDHPELELARMLGLKITKRDELLLHIIQEKHLKLIAVAGTHGKTTTTAMTVWTMQQLGVSVSYSVGTTMAFGPSGHYEPGSEYFVYECDEFDRNFLQFSPYLSLITSVDYDHPDTYGSPDDYIAAFRQFLAQSSTSIVWQPDASMLGDIANSWILGDHDVDGITLPGAHNRRNGALVVKAAERLGFTGDAAAAINDFPGVDRRFERLAPNLYTDYGHHPVEIAATLQLANELNRDVVLVYQPHQNLRQHEIRSQYTDCFEQAKDIYWLPTYLTRENPSLAVLTSEELTENVTNRSALHFAELDDTLWEDIQQARDRGALVLLMGAGSIDGWARSQLATRHATSTILIDTEGAFILEKHSNQQDDIDTGTISLLSGTVEDSDDSLRQAAARDLREKTGLALHDDDLQYFKLFKKTMPDDSMAYIAYYALAGIEASLLQQPTNSTYIKITPNELGTYPLTVHTRSVITEFTHPTL